MATFSSWICPPSFMEMNSSFLFFAKASENEMILQTASPYIFKEPTAECTRHRVPHTCPQEADTWVRCPGHPRIHFWDKVTDKVSYFSSLSSILALGEKPDRRLAAFSRCPRQGAGLRCSKKTKHQFSASLTILLSRRLG